MVASQRHARDLQPTGRLNGKMWAMRLLLSVTVPPLLSEASQDSGDVLLITCERAGEEGIDLGREMRIR
jgi:hypothetical protein